MQETHRFYPWVRSIPWRRKWQPTLVFFPGEPHGQRSLTGYSPWGRKRVGHDVATKQQLYSLALHHSSGACGLMFVFLHPQLPELREGGSSNSERQWWKGLTKPVAHLANVCAPVISRQCSLYLGNTPLSKAEPLPCFWELPFCWGKQIMNNMWVSWRRLSDWTE